MPAAVVSAALVFRGLYLGGVGGLFGGLEFVAELLEKGRFGEYCSGEGFRCGFVVSGVRAFDDGSFEL